jgi:hypothetical protein
LAGEERLRLARLEDVLAAGFARELQESTDGMRSRVLAAMALRGMLEVWEAWMEQHVTDADLQLAEVLEAKAEYIVRLLGSGFAYIDLLPSPAELAAASR